MDSQSAKVSMWLSKMFGDQQVPSYEVNPWTTDILCRLMEWNETRDHDVELLIEDVKQKTEEYKSDTSYLEDFLMASVGLSASSLSSNGSGFLKMLVDSSLALQLKDTSQTSFMLAIDDLTSDRLTSENRSQREILSELSKKLTESIMLEKSLQADLQKIDHDVMEQNTKAENKKQNMDFFVKKMKEWSQLSKNLENELKKVGFDPSLNHRSLVELSEKLENVKKEVASLNAKLKSYLDLTPNLYAAKVKVEETKLELKKIDLLLAEKMENLESLMSEGNLFK
ncbi:HAUS augmin-like complex subunit 1 [Amblyraja radiata]|uniref:HAUS augmin-like complex subunit 1 n=1 Tax=Amblyraja radiata TaxID=386614 RepID=UPI001402B9BB|nr:HAUS augmin-like complex subunit 1 [Amblyraja radiata]